MIYYILWIVFILIIILILFLFIKIINENNAYISFLIEIKKANIKKAKEEIKKGKN